MLTTTPLPDSIASIPDHLAYQLPPSTSDWISSLSLTSARSLPLLHPSIPPPSVLILYGSLRSSSYSRLLAFEFARLLSSLSASVRVFNPVHLPLHSSHSSSHPSVVELRHLCRWASAHLWVSPELHGALSGVMKNQLDLIPLEDRGERPTEGKLLAVAQVNGAGQSFNAVNQLRLLGRWMRMMTTVNHASIPQVFNEFDREGRMKEGPHRDRVVDVAEELFRLHYVMAPHHAMINDRFSEREANRRKAEQQSKAQDGLRHEKEVIKANVADKDTLPSDIE